MSLFLRIRLALTRFLLAVAENDRNRLENDLAFTLDRADHRVDTLRTQQKDLEAKLRASQYLEARA